MRRINYASKFTEAIDDLLVNSTGLNPLPSFSECYRAMPDLHDKLKTAAQDVCDRLKLPSFESLINTDKSKKKDFSFIQSVVGDDEKTTTDSQAFGPLLIVAGPIISRVKVSWKDTGISKEVGNYAEGWTIVPPTTEASFEAVNRRHQRNGVPIVLDGVKLKLASPVRKQSKLELDLESKMKKISEAASWTHPAWFTYDYHQMMIIIAQNVFDFRDARSFPYLYTSEGGCGGLPPYSNLDTVKSAIFAFHKGKAKRTIYGIMHETLECHQGRLKPSETFFLRSTHIAQLGDQAWLKYDQVYRQMLKNSTPMDAKRQLDVLADKEALPAELLQKSAEVSPENVVIGTAISHLRHDGFIMTELDVKMFLESQKKIQALGGKIPFSQILSEIEDEKTKFKSNSWTVLGEISKLFSTEDFTSIGKLDELPLLEDEDGHETADAIMTGYYGLRSERYAEFTSFSYTDAIRVFKTSDVEEYIQRKGNVLRSDIVTQMSLPLSYRFSTDIVSERERKERILSWISGGDLNDLLNHPLPPGIGPDDSRIFLRVFENLSRVIEEETVHRPPVILLLSGDRRLARDLYNYARVAHPKKKWAIYTIEPMQYIGLCLTHLRAREDREDWAMKPQNFKVWNYLALDYMDLPDQVVSDLYAQLRIKLGVRHFMPIIEYDFPNLERALEPGSYRRETNTVSIRKSGFLRSQTLTSMSRRTSWACQPMDSIFGWDDFSVTSKTTYPLVKPKNFGSFFNNPVRPDLYRAIASWNQRVV